MNFQTLETRIALTVGQIVEQKLDEIKSLSLKFYSADEVAKMLSVDVQLIHKLCKGGEIKYIRVGKLIRIEQKELLKWLESFS